MTAAPAAAAATSLFSRCRYLLRLVLDRSCAEYKFASCDRVFPYGSRACMVGRSVAQKRVQLHCKFLLVCLAMRVGVSVA